MLRAKFDGGFENTPATYIWSRLVRMKSTRSGASQKEEAGHLIGGYATLMKAMADKIEAAGGKIHLRTPVQEVVIEQGRARGIRIGQEVRPFDAVVVTMQAPVFRRLIPGATAGVSGLSRQDRIPGHRLPAAGAGSSADGLLDAQHHRRQHSLHRRHRDDGLY